MENGRLQRYLLLLVAFALLAGALPFVERPARASAGRRAAGPSAGLRWCGRAVVWLIGVACALATVVFHRRRLLALILLGAVGLMVSLAFVNFSAPDLALTQLLVEMATIVLMMLALKWLPQEGAPEPGRARRGRDVAIAIAAGSGVAARLRSAGRRRARSPRISSSRRSRKAAARTWST